MAQPKRFRPSILLELFLDTLLLLGFMAQAFVAVCLIIYGYLPLPAEWGNRLIAANAPEGIHIKAGQLRLHGDGTLQIVGFELRASHIAQPLLYAKDAEVQLAFNGFTSLPSVESVLFSGGTLYIPSIYSPDGHHRPLLERIAFRMHPRDHSFEVDRFAALHDQIRLRGTFVLPRTASGESFAPVEAIDQLYTQAAKLYQQKERIRYFKSPTIAFKASLADAENYSFFVRVSSPRAELPGAEADKIQIKTFLKWDGQKLTTRQPPLLNAATLSIPDYKIHVDELTAEIPTESVPLALEGRLPQMRLAAKALCIDRFDLDAPILTLDPSHLPQLYVEGATRGLDGAIRLKGQLNTKDWSGQVRARGSVDLAELTPENITSRLPDIHFESAPYFDLNLFFKESFALDTAQLRANVSDLVVEGLHFDHIQAEGSYQDGLYSIDDFYLQRQAQWLDLKFSLDTTNYDYRVTLIGSAVPYDYNPILPRWWAAIFKDFDFSDVTYSLGDFIIYGNSKRKASDLYYGRAEARAVRYRDVFLDEGELIVRGRGPYTELHQLEARSGQGWARGDVSFSSKIDEVKGPASIRLAMDAQLTLDDAAKLFGGNIAAILADFETTALPVTKLEGAIFNDAYPQYAGKSYFDLTAKTDQPLTYKKIPLDYLSFDLFGRSDITYLRNLGFGYADGKGQASIDVITPTDAPNSVRYQLQLADADQNEAIRDLPQLDGVEDSLETETAANTTQPQREVSRVDLRLHGQGPIDDAFAHNGFGAFEMRSEKLGTIQLLGPLSRLLQNTQFNFTSLNLKQMRGTFRYENELVTFAPLRIDGPLTQIRTPGTLNLQDHSLDMRVSVNLFKNAGQPDSKIRKIGDLITKPIPNLLEFELTGTIQDQKLRSLYDPRNLIPRF